MTAQRAEPRPVAAMPAHADVRVHRVPVADAIQRMARVAAIIERDREARRTVEAA